jgi:hypothetical protein
MRLVLRKVAVAFVAPALLLAGAELAARCLFFQLKGRHALAVQDAVVYLRDRRAQAVRERKLDRVAQLKQRIQGYDQRLYTDMGRALLERFSQEYERRFAELAAAAREAETRLLVLYVPSSGGSGPSAAEAYCRPFFAALAKQYAADFLDVTDAFRRYPLEQVTLMPQNSHPSRFGNQLIAEELDRVLDRRCRSPRQYDGHPRICGDLTPGGSVWTVVPEMPYFVNVNRQGFRMDRDLDVPKKRQRVLILGDSFTFGPYLPNHDTYPSLLAARAPDLEVVNAGVAGYTITDEAALFIERARRVAPDITVLQVLDNDITDLFWFHRNEFDRGRRTFRPSPLEKEFVEAVAAKRAGTNEPPR